MLEKHLAGKRPAGTRPSGKRPNGEQTGQEKTQRGKISGEKTGGENACGEKTGRRDQYALYVSAAALFVVDNGTRKIKGNTDICT